MTSLRIVADENIPAVDALFGELATIHRAPGRTMNADDLAGADVLLVRSVTKVNQALLAKSQVKFVGTCTIGTDHIDKPFLDKAGIAWSAAPGCNAGGVVQFALAAMARYAPDWAEKTVGIVGCGNVGGRLYRTLKALGVTVKVADPFKSNADIPELTSLEEVLTSDIVCCHTPLTKDGEHPTENLLNAENLTLLKPDALLINAGRGEVIDNPALYAHLQAVPSLRVVLDVWAGEPDIFTPLMEPILCGTPHIAGYSFEGKLNGSLMIYEALAEHLQLPAAAVAQRVANVKQEILGEPVPLVAKSINEAILKTYDIEADNALIADVLAREEPIKTAFDKLRKGYWQRRELGHYYCESGDSCENSQVELQVFLSAVNSVTR